MKKFVISLLRVLIVVAILILTVLLVVKIRKDTLAEKEKQEYIENVRVESESICKFANEQFNKIKEAVKKDVNKNIVLADTGNLTKIDLYFVVEENGNYKYVVRKKVDDKDKYAVAEDNSQEGKYIISIDALGIKNCVYTNIDNYCIDEDGIITYIDN